MLCQSSWLTHPVGDVTVSFNCQFDTIWNHWEEVGLWECLCEIVLIMLIKMGRPTHWQHSLSFLMATCQSRKTIFLRPWSLSYFWSPEVSYSESNGHTNICYKCCFFFHTKNGKIIHIVRGFKSWITPISKHLL